jgi:hypothetical protein
LAWSLGTDKASVNTTTTATADPVKTYHLSQHSVHLSSFNAGSSAASSPLNFDELSPSAIDFANPYGGGNSNGTNKETVNIVQVKTTCTAGPVGQDIISAVENQ